MAPISTAFLAPQASSVALASAAPEDPASLQSEISNYPLISITIIIWAVVCVVAICSWLGRGGRVGAGTHWIPEDEKGGSLRKRTSWPKRRSSGKHYGPGLPIVAEKVPTIAITPASAAPPLRMPKPARTRTSSAPRLVQFSPCTPTILSAPLAKPVFPTLGNASLGGTPFWAPAWALQAAEARANLKAAQAPASPTLSPATPSSTWSPLTPDIDFPEVPAEIVSRIRREPIPIFMGA